MVRLLVASVLIVAGMQSALAGFEKSVVEPIIDYASIGIRVKLTDHCISGEFLETVNSYKFSCSILETNPDHSSIKCPSGSDNLRFHIRTPIDLLFDEGQLPSELKQCPTTPPSIEIFGEASGGGV